jgi:hypothetical protein
MPKSQITPIPSMDVKISYERVPNTKYVNFFATCALGRKQIATMKKERYSFYLVGGYKRSVTYYLDMEDQIEFNSIAERLKCERQPWRIAQHIEEGGWE